MLVEETNRYYDQTVTALGGLETFHHRSSYECIYPCFKRFHTLTVYKAECTDAFHSLPQKYRLDPESEKSVQQQNAVEGTRHRVLEILPPTP